MTLEQLKTDLEKVRPGESDKIIQSMREQHDPKFSWCKDLDELIEFSYCSEAVMFWFAPWEATKEKHTYWNNLYVEIP